MVELRDFNQAEEQRQEILDNAAKLEEMVETRGWKDVIIPYLDSRSVHAWEDPQNVGDINTFFYRYAVQWAKAEAAFQFKLFVDGIIAHAKKIRESKDKKEENA